jgi:hypothetical protein
MRKIILHLLYLSKDKCIMLKHVFFNAKGKDRLKKIAKEAQIF